MFFHLSMARLTAHAGHDRLDMQLSTGHTAIGVASEATGRVGWFQAAARGLDDRPRFRADASDGYIERRRRAIETDAALVHRPIVLENVGLAVLSAAEWPKVGGGKGRSPTGHGKDAAIA